MTFDEMFEKIDPIEGWMPYEDLMVVYEYASRIDGLIVEIGSYRGRTTKLLELCSPAKIVSVDIENKPSFESPRVEFHLKPSLKAAKSFDRKISLLIIDGDHRKNAVIKDIKAWVHHLKSGSYALFHDFTYSNESTDVVGALDKVGKKYFKTIENPWAISQSGDARQTGWAVCKKI